MGDVFQEVDEEVRRDQYLRLWQAYGRYVVVAVAVVVIGTGAVVGWDYYRTQSMLADSAQFAAAADLLDQGKASEAAEAFAMVATEAGAGYAALARLREAAALLETDDRAGAIEVYRQLATDGGADALLRDWASFLGALHALEAGQASEVDDWVARLLEGDGPWRGLARELQGLAALEMGRSEDARAIFTELSTDATAPQGVRGRAGEVLATIGGQGG